MKKLFIDIETLGMPGEDCEVLLGAYRIDNGPVVILNMGGSDEIKNELRKLVEKYGEPVQDPSYNHSAINKILKIKNNEKTF